MPIIKSAVKRVRQTKKRTARNARIKRQLKNATRALDAAITAKQKTKLPELMDDVQSALDTAVKKNIMHRNRAARIKSRYARIVKETGGKTSSAAKKKSPAKNKTSTSKKAKSTATKKPAAKKTAKKPTKASTKKK